MDSFSKCVFVRAGKHTSVHDVHPHSNVFKDIIVILSIVKAVKWKRGSEGHMITMFILISIVADSLVRRICRHTFQNTYLV